MSRSMLAPSPVRMYIDKFKKEVLIEPDHPLAVAQLALNAGKVVTPKTTTSPASTPADAHADDSDDEDEATDSSDDADGESAAAEADRIARRKKKLAARRAQR